MMFELATFLPEHVKEIDPHPAYQGAKESMAHSSEAFFKSSGCYSSSIMIDGKVEGCLGLVMEWDKTAYAWSYLSKKACLHPYSLSKLVSKLLNMYEIGLCLDRISATTRCDSLVSRRWLQSLGFVQEGIMRKYGPDGSDYALYARVR